MPDRPQAGIYNGITQVWEVLEWRQSAANRKVQPAGSLQPTPPLWWHEYKILVGSWVLETEPDRISVFHMSKVARERMHKADTVGLQFTLQTQN